MYHLKIFLRSFHGALLVRNHDVHEDLLDMYGHIFHDLEMKGPSEDRKNLHSDIHNIKRDIKESIKAYKAEKISHG